MNACILKGFIHQIEIVDSDCGGSAIARSSSSILDARSERKILARYLEIVLLSLVMVVCIDAQ